MFSPSRNSILRRWRTSVHKSVSAAAVLAGACMALVSPTTLPAGQNSGENEWKFDGQNTGNTRHNPHFKAVNQKNVKDLRLKWIYPKEGHASAAETSGTHSSIVSADGILYMVDSSNNLIVLDAETGDELMAPVSIPALDLGLGPDIRMPGTRSPAIVGDKLIIVGRGGYGENADGVCKDGQVLGVDCAKARYGAVIAVLDRSDLSVVWATIVDRNFASRVTASPMVHNGVIYIGISSGEEAADGEDLSNLTGNPSDEGKPYPCCAHKGSVVAVDLHTGNILWKTYVTPLDFDPMALAANDPDRLFFTQPDPNRPPIAQFEKWSGGQMLNYNVFSATPANKANQPAVDGGFPMNTASDLLHYNKELAGFSGVSVWGSTIAIDEERNQLYVGTSSNYNAPLAYKLCRLYRVNPSAFSEPPSIAVFNLPGGKDRCDEIDSLDEINHHVGNFITSVLAMDLDTGEIKANFNVREYDTWQFACAAPDLGFAAGPLEYRSTTFPPPSMGPGGNGNFSYYNGLYGANILNCASAARIEEADIAPCAAGDIATCEQNIDAKLMPEGTGPDIAYATGPMFMKVKKSKRHSIDLVGAADKAGIFVALDPDTLQPLPGYINQTHDPRIPLELRDGIQIGEGGVLGGVHFSGIGFDGRYVYMANANSPQYGRDPTKPLIQNPVDGHTVWDNPFNDNMLTSAFFGDENFFLRILDSGPRYLRALVNPPSDVKADAIGDLVPGPVLQEKLGGAFSVETTCLFDPNTIKRTGPNKHHGLPIAVIEVRHSAPGCQDIGRRGDLITTAGSYTKLDPLTGKILWQRPTLPIIRDALDLSNLPNTAVNAIPPLLNVPKDHRGRGMIYGGGITLANGLLYSGISDQQSSFIALDTDTGELRFECHGTYLDTGMIGGDAGEPPLVVGDMVYYQNSSLLIGTSAVRSVNSANRLFAFHLGKTESDEPIQCVRHGGRNDDD